MGDEDRERKLTARTIMTRAAATETREVLRDNGTDFQILPDYDDLES